MTSAWLRRMKLNTLANAKIKKKRSVSLTAVLPKLTFQSTRSRHSLFGVTIEIFAELRGRFFFGENKKTDQRSKVSILGKDTSDQI